MSSTRCDEMLEIVRGWMTTNGSQPSTTTYVVYVGAEYCYSSRAFERKRREAASKAAEGAEEILEKGIARLAVRFPTMSGVGFRGSTAAAAEAEGVEEGTEGGKATSEKMPAPWLDVLAEGLCDEEQATKFVRLSTECKLPQLLVLTLGGGEVEPPTQAALSEELADMAAAVSPRAPPPTNATSSEEGASTSSTPVPTTAQPATDATTSPTEGTEMSTAAGCIAAALEAYNAGDLASAAALFSDAIEQDPSNRDASYNLGSLLLAVGKPLLAVPHFQHVVLIDPTDRTASHVLGGVLGDMEPVAVADAYREVVKQQPNNARAKHMLATLTGEGESSQSAAADYVREIFDELSEEFEDKLVNHLEYQTQTQTQTQTSSAPGAMAAARGSGRDGAHARVEPSSREF